MTFSEDFLHFLWKFQLFDKLALRTASGETLQIIYTGVHNKDAGPDFEQAQIRIDGTTWAGNVEIHLRSSDWDKHNHSEDGAYNNVILHVVYEHDKAIFRDDNTEIQTLILNKRVPAEIEFRYRELMQNMNWIPCEKQVSLINDIYIKSWLSRVLVERLKEKSETINEVLEKYKGSWNDAFYIILARNFGFKTNALPFELLAQSLPQQILARHKHSDLQVEALIFGQAGFLNANFDDKYPQALKKEYNYLSNKYNLKSLDRFIWKFLRLRPQNFPTLRLAQFAALILKSNHLFSKVIEITNVKEIRDMFTDLPVNNYWKMHFRFDKGTNSMSAQMGDEAINNILLNTVSLFLFAYGKQMGNDLYIKRSLKLLESLPPEINQITRRFNEIGLKPGSGDVSQAMLQLKKYYCDAKKCLYCGIGVKLINQTDAAASVNIF